MFQSGTSTRDRVYWSTPREVGTCLSRRSHTRSCRDRRLIQPTTVGPPAIVAETRSCALLHCAPFWRQPAKPRVCAMTVKIPLELKELHFQINGRPEQRPVETLAAYRADEAFDEWMRQRRLLHRLNSFHVKDSQTRLPLVESVQRIMVQAEVLRRRVAAGRSIEHVAQRHTIDDAAVHAEAHDAPRTVVHHHEHPMRMQDGRFAPKTDPNSIDCPSRDQGP